MSNTSAYYIQVNSQYINIILSTIEAITSEILFDINFTTKETKIYSVSNNVEGLGLKLYVVLNQVTYYNDDETRSNLSFIVDTSNMLTKTKSFHKDYDINISTNELTDYVILESFNTVFLTVDNISINTKHRIHCTCEKSRNPLNHIFDPTEYPIVRIQDSAEVEENLKYYAQYLVYDLSILHSFLKNTHRSESLRIQFDKNATVIYINNTNSSPTLDTIPQVSIIESRIVKMISLSNVDKIAALKKICKHVSVKVHRYYPNGRNQSSENKVFDIDALVVHPIDYTNKGYEVTFIINCDSRS